MVRRPRLEVPRLREILQLRGELDERNVARVDGVEDRLGHAALRVAPSTGIAAREREVVLVDEDARRVGAVVGHAVDGHRTDDCEEVLQRHRVDVDHAVDGSVHGHGRSSRGRRARQREVRRAHHVAELDVDVEIAVEPVPPFGQGHARLRETGDAGIEEVADLDRAVVDRRDTGRGGDADRPHLRVVAPEDEVAARAEQECP